MFYIVYKWKGHKAELQAGKPLENERKENMWVVSKQQNQKGPNLSNKNHRNTMLGGYVLSSGVWEKKRGIKTMYGKDRLGKLV